MRDFFVGSLVVGGIFLVTYKVFECNLDNTVSIIAGVAAFGVAFFPTGIPSGVNAVATPLQDRWGAEFVAVIHFVCAVIFILCLAVLSICFGIREGKRSERQSSQLWRMIHTPGPDARKRIHWSCALAIVLAILLFLTTKSLGVFERHSLLVAEIVALEAFGCSWLYKGAELGTLIPGWRPGWPRWLRQWLFRGSAGTRPARSR